MTITINTPEELIKALNQSSVAFSTVMEVIDNNYNFYPTAFKNGQTFNEENTNNGSCKVFSFAQMHNLSEQATLNAFGDYYLDDVLKHPDNDDHQNIRNFMESGWNGIEFKSQALTTK